MSDFLKGITRALGVGAGYLPIAISFGTLATQSGISSTAAVIMSMWVYAGAAQFAAIEGIKQNLFWLTIVVTMLLINLRHIPMSLASNRIFSAFESSTQLFLAHGLTDEAFALDVSDKPRSWHYYAGIHLFYWFSWVCGTWIGCQLGHQLPTQWLQFALPSLFICLLCDSLKNRWNYKSLIIIISGIILVLITQNLGTIGILLSIIGLSLLTSFLVKT